jgi:hypothetical protein
MTVTMTCHLKHIMSSTQARSSPSNNMSRIQTFVQNNIINPYRKITNIAITDLSNPAPTSIPLPVYTRKHGTTNALCNREDIEAWGDPIHSKNTQHTRLFFQNVNGLSTKDYAKWINSLE